MDDTFYSVRLDIINDVSHFPHKISKSHKLQRTTKNMQFHIFTFMAFCQNVAFGDMYLQFPGGGNNRLNERNRARQNKNRLFDSQNNARFGHNQHTHYFYTDSEIDMQWTVQHSCGPDSNLNCDVILQYACEDDLRDGEVTSTIPDKNSKCKDGDCNTDFRYGMHENYQYYQHCALRERNNGLYRADRNLRGDNARYTRQEERGARYGYECNEERDHYPYWHPTIWKDIAIFTDDTSRCPYYQQESENVKGRWYCHVSDEFLNEHYDPKDENALIPINEEDCNSMEGAEWKQSEPHKYPDGFDMESPVCEEAPYQRDNHHGNGDNRYFVGHKWTVPEHLVHSNCAVRIRYNITSSDYDAWNIDRSDKVRNDRLDDHPNTFAGKCFGIGEGPNVISNIKLNDLNIDMNNTLKIDARNDNRFKLTRDTVDMDTWRLTTRTVGLQWIAWQHSHFGGKKVKVSFDVKFATKPTSGNYGVDFMRHLQIREWVDEAPVGTWYHVELEETLPRRGSGVRLIFDKVSVDLELRDFQVCVEDEFAEKRNPFYEMQDAFGWDPHKAKSRGYENKNDPELQIFERIPMKLDSPYNTDQLGRVFEDRSHKIEFVQLPQEIKDDITLNNKKIYNLNARGKIGNNVEVYPAFEYDFAPSRLVAQLGDYIHIQWSGSNSNDRGNDHSQKTENFSTPRVLQGKDRHNMVAVDSMGAIRPTSDLQKLSSLIGMSAYDSMMLAFSGTRGGDNEYMQSAGAYFDLGIRKLTEAGKHIFMSSVNNAHGVRTQKGKVIVS